MDEFSDEGLARAVWACTLLQPQLSRDAAYAAGQFLDAAARSAAQAVPEVGLKLGNVCVHLVSLNSVGVPHSSCQAW